MEIKTERYIVRFANEPNLELIKKETERYVRRIYAEGYRIKERNQQHEEEDKTDGVAIRNTLGRKHP